MEPSQIEKTEIVNEVKEQFNQLITSLNQINTIVWSEFYSKDKFLSVFLSTDLYSNREAFVDSIANYFSMREHQSIDPIEVQITPLTSEIALLTSMENTEIKLKSSEIFKSKHVFTMLWKKEHDGWKIIHSHESWVDEKIN